MKWVSKSGRKWWRGIGKKAKKKYVRKTSKEESKIGKKEHRCAPLKCNIYKIYTFLYKVMFKRVPETTINSIIKCVSNKKKGRW